MNDSSSYLVTIYTFKGKDYLVKMNVLNRNTLELKVTDKITSEDWHCSYDSTYIENLTHKTGNYKQFDIFTTMLKSGLLKTSESITLDLLTFDDLEALRSRRIMGRTFPPHSAHILPASTSNRRYLILTYTVEFDRIHYPLPMEYCGLPDPHILQSTIRRLEQEVVQLQDQLSHSGTQCCDEDLVEQVNILEKRVLELTSENEQLRSEIIRLNNQLNKKQPTQKHAEVLQNALLTLEEQVQKERLSLHHQIRNLKEEKKHINSQLEESKLTEKRLRSQLHRALEKSSSKFSTRPSRIDNFHKRSPCRNIPDHHTCVTILQDNKPVKDGLKKRNGKRSPLPGTKSEFPLTHRSRRNSSASSSEKQHLRCPSCSPRRSSSNESLNPATIHSTGIKSKLKSKKHSVQDYSSSSESSLSMGIHTQKNFTKRSVKKTKSSKDLKNDIRICDLEKRISNLQQILESDLTISRRNIH